MRYLLLLLAGLLTAIPVHASPAMKAEQTLNALSIDRLEWQGASTFNLEIEGWYGTSLNRLMYGIETEQTGNNPPESDFDVGWQSAISPFWDAGAFMRRHDGDDLERTWFGVGLSGMLPYFIHFDGLLMTGEGDLLFDAELKHELPLTTHWTLESRIEIEAISGDKSGFNELSIGLRFGHESPNRLTRYIGVEWHKSPLQNTRRTALVAGISYWY